MRRSPILVRHRSAARLEAAFVCAVLTWIHAETARADDYGALGDEIVAHVRDQFFDGKRAAAWAEKHARYGAAAKNAADFERLTNTALAELAASHTAYYPKDSSENLQLRSLYQTIIKAPEPEIESVGADFVKTGSGYFVRQVFAKSPAAYAGSCVGIESSRRMEEPSIRCARSAVKTGVRFRSKWSVRRTRRRCG